MTRMTVRRGVRGGFALVLTLTMGLGSARLSAAEGPVRIAYVDWSSSVASANLVCAVLRERLDRRCELIESTASGMAATERALDAYGLDDLRLVQGSEREMTEDLAHAIAGGRPIVVTGWQPHWMFGRWSLRFLDDPKKVYGGTGTIHTMVRPGLEIDDPGVYGVLDRFRWDPDARWITPGKRYRAEGAINETAAALAAGTARGWVDDRSWHR